MKTLFLQRRRGLLDLIFLGLQTSFAIEPFINEFSAEDSLLGGKLPSDSIGTCAFFLKALKCCHWW
jgi:hypothetical protein